MSRDQYLFIEPDESVYVIAKCKSGYEVFRMYVDKTHGTCSAFVENLNESDTVDLSSAGSSLIDGYRKKKTSMEANL
jgi:hypothetical protein